ncbi:MAG: hypothetical protein KIS92_02525 [Planctomycetota bacterium]|nr:hypothetical protein [Planctomycetota bacterium]
MKMSFKTLMLACVAGAMSVAMTGCKYERDDRDSAFYNDVGETDIDRRVFASQRKGTADMSVPEDTRVVQKRRRFNEVGETSLDFGSQEQAAEKPRKSEKKSKPVSMAKPAETQPVVYAKPEAVSQAPVRYVPAPAPAPEYRRSVSVGETELGR